MIHVSDIRSFFGGYGLNEVAESFVSAMIKEFKTTEADLMRKPDKCSTSTPSGANAAAKRVRSDESCDDQADKSDAKKKSNVTPNTSVQADDVIRNLRLRVHEHFRKVVPKTRREEKRDIA